MGRTHFSGPVTGPYTTIAFRTGNLALSTADQLLAAITIPFENARLVKIRLRTLNIGTGTLTAHKVRRVAAQNGVVVVGDTQVLSADGGAIAANSLNTIHATSTVPTLLATQRDFTQAQQLGIFGSTDGGTANQVAGEVVFVVQGETSPSLDND